MRLSMLKIGFVLMLTFSLSGCIGAEWQTREIIQNPDGLNRIERNSYTTEHEFKQIRQSFQFKFIVVETSHCGVNVFKRETNEFGRWRSAESGYYHFWNEESGDFATLTPGGRFDLLFGVSVWLGTPDYFQWNQDSALTVKDWDKENSKRVATIRFTKRNFKLLSYPLFIGALGSWIWMPCIFDDMDTDEIITDYYNTLPLSQRYTLIKNDPEIYNYFYDLEQLDQLLWKYPGAVIREFSKVPDFVLWKRLYEDAKKHGMEATFVYLFWEAMKNSQRQTFYRVVPDSPFR